MIGLFIYETNMTTYAEIHWKDVMFNRAISPTVVEFVNAIKTVKNMARAAYTN